MNRRTNAIPDWLANVSANSMEKHPFPLHDLLRDSLYYPASGLDDGSPVKNLAGCVFSFVYVDNGSFSKISRTSLDSELEERGFWGYQIVARRDVSREELFPRGPTVIQEILSDELGIDWHRNLPPRGEAPFFCDWLVFEREAEFGSGHGPTRFSWLFVCAEGVRTFVELYVANFITPGAVAVIQSGMGMPLEQPDGLFARCVLANPAGHPKILLLGGAGTPDQYREMCWPDYRPPRVDEWESIQRKAFVRPHENCCNICDDAVFVEYDYEDFPPRVAASTTLWLKDS